MQDEPNQGKSEEEIRRLAAKFFGMPNEELVKDPEFQQLTQEDVNALATEHYRRAADETDAGAPASPPVLISDDADWDRPAALKLKDGRVAVLPQVTVREAGKLVQQALEMGLPIGGELDPRLVENIRADEEEGR